MFTLFDRSSVVAVGKRILVVEDTEDIRDFVRAALEREGYQVETSLTGLCLQNHVPDLILLDVLISEAIGCDLYRQWQMRTLTTAPPLLLFSAHAHVVQAFFQLHVPIFLAQPFYIRDLLDMVRKYTHTPALEG